MMAAGGRILPVALALTTLLAVSPAGHVASHSGDELTSGGAMPTIDGVRGTGEWDGATAVPVFPDGLTGSTLYIANDGVHLYIALHVTDATLDDLDVFEVRFDNDHDGTPTHGDDAVTLFGSGAFRDQHYDEGLDSPGLPDDREDGSGAAGHADGAGFFELAHPLHSGDDEDLAVSAGDTIGLCVRYRPEGAGSSANTFPEGCFLALHEQSLYADLTLSAAIGDVNCDGTVNSIDAALVLQLAAGLVASLACETGDVNVDGATDAVDAALILQFGAGFLVRLPP